MDSTTSTDGTVIAHVSCYDPVKKFGFAEAGRYRVFFHMSACREVEGTPEAPQLTNRLCDREPRWWKGTRRLEWIVVKMVDSPKGPKAAAWGYKPVRTWVEDLAHFGRLKQYATGHVRIDYRERQFGASYAKSEGKLAAAPTLTLGDQPTLRLSYDAYDGQFGVYGEPSGRKDITFDLAEAMPSKASGGRYALDVYLNGKSVYIVLYPPGEWFGA